MSKINFIHRCLNILKPNALFVHTNKPFPSLIIFLANNSPHQSVLNQTLKNISNSNFLQEINKITLPPTKPNLHHTDQQAEITIPAKESQLKSINGIEINDKSKFMVVNARGKIEILSKESKEQKLAVIFSENIEKMHIECIQSNFQYGISLLIKWVMVTSCFLCFGATLVLTRVENHHLLESKLTQSS